MAGFSQAVFEAPEFPEPTVAKRVLNASLNSLPPRVLANRVARVALKGYYQKAFGRAKTHLLSTQRSENLARLGRIGNGPIDFVMIRSGLSGSTELVWMREGGGLTGEHIHINIREHLKNKYQWENEITLRICRDVPWLDYLHNRLPNEDVPCNSMTCHHLLGANLVYFVISSGKVQE